jgi:cytochrome c oxidase subunit 2
MDIQKLLFLPALASAHGGDLDRLTFYVHLLMGVLFTGWAIYFVVALFKFRASAHPVANPDGVESHASSYIEVAVVAAEAILLLGFSVPLWAARVDQFPPEKDATRVRVVGQQFAWNIHYPGPDGLFGKTDITLVDAQANPLGIDKNDPAATDDFTTVNQLHLPVDKPAIVYLSSMDVIHSFGLQEMRVKQDAIPGIVTPVWFKPVVTSGEMKKRKGDDKWSYEISCAQLCGLGHYRMRGYVSIDTPEQYAAWTAEQAKAASEAGSGGEWN